MSEHDETHDEAPYDPAEDLTRVSGADYLEVKNRIKWLRDRDPNAVMRCELVREDKDAALFKATVTLSTGGHAEAHGSETKSDFRDFLEKAETKALGRALAMLGFGTQFVESELNGKQGSRVVDAPVRRARERQQSDPPAQRQSAQNRAERAPNGSRDEEPGRERQPNGEGKPVLDRQKSAIRDLAKRGGYDADALETIIAEHSAGVISVDDLTFEEAAAVITALRKPRGGSQGNA